MYLRSGCVRACAHSVHTTRGEGVSCICAAMLLTQQVVPNCVCGSLCLVIVPLHVRRRPEVVHSHDLGHGEAIVSASIAIALAIALAALAAAAALD